MPKLPFGKHMKDDITDVPLSYLRWFETIQRLSQETRALVNHEIERRTGERSSVGRVVTQEEIERKKHSR